MELTRTPARTALYARISPDDPESMLFRALTACELYAHARGLNPFLVLKDRADATLLDRPGLAALRGAVRSRLVDAVVVQHLEQLGRHMEDLEMLRQEFDVAGVALHVLPDAPSPEQRQLVEAGLAPSRIRPRVDAGLVELGAAVPGAMRDGDLESSYMAALAVADQLGPLIERGAYVVARRASPSLPFLDSEDDTWLGEDRSVLHELPWTPIRELRAAVYARAVDLGSGITPEQQLVEGKRAGRAVAREQGYRLLATVEDWSGDGDLARPGLDALRLLARDRVIDVVVIASWRMLAPDRSTILALRREFLSGRCSIHSLLADMPK